MSDGRVVQLEIDSDALDSCARRQFHTNAVQTAMSNFLSNIGQTGECLSRVKLDSEAKDSILEQLAIAGSLLHSPSASPIHCNIVATSDEYSTPPCCRIVASLSNRSSFTLGQSWTFLISMSPTSMSCSCEHRIGGSTCAKSCSEDNHSLYTSRDISGLSPRQSESLSLVVPLNEHSFMPHTVETTLVYTPVSQADAAVKQIAIPLASQVVDILDFVQLASSSATSVRARPRSCFALECRKLQQLCRPQVQNISDPMSVCEPESKKITVASVKERVISLYASKLSNIQGSYFFSELLFYTYLKI